MRLWTFTHRNHKLSRQAYYPTFDISRVRRSNKLMGVDYIIINLIKLGTRADSRLVPGSLTTYATWIVGILRRDSANLIMMLIRHFHKCHSIYSNNLTSVCLYCNSTTTFNRQMLTAKIHILHFSTYLTWWGFTYMKNNMLSIMQLISAISYAGMNIWSCEHIWRV